MPTAMPEANWGKQKKVTVQLRNEKGEKGPFALDRSSVHSIDTGPFEVREVEL